MPGASLESLGHCLAAVLLLTFAFSHFAAFAVHLPSQASVNTVFPFLTNRTMYLLAGVLELITAVICLLKRGRQRAHVAILMFIFVMIWYRWALFYTGGGAHCECLGILGVALRLSKTQEKVLPIVALVLLGLTVLPWLLRRLAGIMRMTPSVPKVAGNLGLMLIAFLCHSSAAQQTIEVTGRYDTENFNPGTGTPFTNMARHVAFTFTLAGDAWSIWCTNISDAGDGLKTPWEGLVFDGKNTFVFVPHSGQTKGASINNIYTSEC